MAKPYEEETINCLQKEDQTLTNSQEETLQRVHDHFQNLFTPRDRPSDEEPLNIPKVGQSKALTKKFMRRMICKAIKKLKIGKAPGPDGIPNEAIKVGAPILLSHLTRAFNLIILTGQTPPDWTQGIMHLIYKGKGSMTDLNNYRGITVNNALNRLFTSMLNNRLTKLVEQSGALGQIQNGC